MATGPALCSQERLQSGQAAETEELRGGPGTRRAGAEGVTVNDVRFPYHFLLKSVVTPQLSEQTLPH